MIRNACLEDLTTIVDIYNASIPSRMATADLEPVTVASRLDWFHTHTPDRRPLWVLELDGKIGGWLSFRPFYGRAAYIHTAEVGIYISPDYQHQGWGSKLLSHAIASSPDLAIETLLGFIFAHNQPSLQLFTQQGFVRWGFLPGVATLDDRQRDLVILGKKIDPVKTSK
jgi:L-amino acid N-acyltransferase YncA